MNTLLSTLSLVVVRSMGVAARALGLLTLAAGMPAERFAHYALALVLSELARCVTDFGLDPVLLRRAEGLTQDEQRPMIRAALAVRSAHGLLTAILVLAILAVAFPLDLLLVAAGLQFLSQGLLQLGLNWRQINNSAHRVAPALAAFYGIVIATAVAAYFVPSLGAFPLPALLLGELAIALWLMSALAHPRLDDLLAGYRLLVPQALPMTGIMLLAFVNTRTDALIVGRLIEPADAGHYLYLSRWTDLAPMLATGLALPLVGKIRGFDIRQRAPLLGLLGLGFTIVPFVLVHIAAHLNPTYASDATLRNLLATIAACRIGLAVTTMTLLAQWRDRILVRLAAFTTMLLPLLTWILGARLGAHGIAAGVLIAETGNLLFQASLLLGRPPLRSAAGKPQ